MRGVSESLIVGFIAWRLLAGGWVRKLTESVALALFIVRIFNCDSASGANPCGTDPTRHEVDRADTARREAIVEKHLMKKAAKQKKPSARQRRGIVAAVRQVIAPAFRRVTGLIDVAL
jgi:hypothetical protein